MAKRVPKSKAGKPKRSTQQRTKAKKAKPRASKTATQLVRNEEKPVYLVSQAGDQFCITCDQREVATPQGRPLRIAFRELAEEICTDLQRYGPDPMAGISMYTCLCSCLDFGSTLGKEALIEEVLRNIPEDPVLHTSADPEIMFVQMAAYSQPYFEEIGLRNKAPKALMKWVAKEMANWTLPEVMVTAMALAHIQSPLIGMAISQDKVDLASAAFGFCGRFWGRKLNALGGISFGSWPSFYPTAADVDFCEQKCLRNDGSEDEGAAPEEFRRKCGMVIVMDVLRRFAAFGRLERIGSASPQAGEANKKVTTDEAGRTRLHLAAMLGMSDEVGLLLKEGASVHVRDSFGMTPLHVAFNASVTNVLLTAGASVDAATSEGMTPLHVAAALDRIEVAKLLLSKGADALVKNKRGHAPLDLACSTKMREMMDKRKRKR